MFHRRNLPTSLLPRSRAGKWINSKKNKQIIISSDRPPKAIPTLEDRLQSRFEGGMIADIGYPDYETRLVILQNKTVKKQVSLSNEILEYIANSFQKNVRELEGALKA